MRRRADRHSQYDTDLFLAFGAASASIGGHAIFRVRVGLLVRVGLCVALPKLRSLGDDKQHTPTQDTNGYSCLAHGGRHPGG